MGAQEVGMITFFVVPGQFVFNGLCINGYGVNHLFVEQGAYAPVEGHPVHTVAFGAQALFQFFLAERRPRLQQKVQQLQANVGNIQSFAAQQLDDGVVFCNHVAKITAFLVATKRI